MILTVRCRRKLICMCRVPGLASKTCSCVIDDYVFLIMDIVIGTRMLITMRTYCLQNNVVELTPS